MPLTEDQQRIAEQEYREELRIRGCDDEHIETVMEFLHKLMSQKDVFVLPETPHTPGDEEVLNSQDTRAALQAWEGALLERERFVLKNRRGADHPDTRPLADLSKELRLSRERVRQIGLMGERRIRRMGMKERLGIPLTMQQSADLAEFRYLIDGGAE